MKSGSSRALDIIEHFDRDANRISMTEIVQRTGLHKATAFRLPCTLAQDDILHQTASGEYELGFFGIWRARDLLRGNALWVAMRPRMKALSDRLNETVALSERRGGQTIDLDMVAAVAAVISTPTIGLRVPFHKSVAGRAILAAEANEWQNVYPARLAAGGSSDHDAGHAGDENDGSVAAPIYDGRGGIVGALWLSVLPGRLVDRTSYERMLKKAACVNFRDITGLRNP